MSEPIKIELQLDGEKQFNQALKSVNGELKNMQSAVKATEAANKGAANTEKALTEKVKALGDASATSGKKVKTLEDIVKKQKQAQLDAAKAIDEVKAKFGEGSKEIEKAENAYRIATDSVNKWETKLNEARVEYAGINAELSKNEGYLEEARSATDKTASSIDEYGKEIKEATDGTKNFQNTVGSAAKLEVLRSGLEAVAEIAGKFSEALKQSDEAADKYETAVAKISTIADEGIDLSQVSSEVRQLAKDYGKTADEIAESTYQAISANVDAADAVEFTSKATKLAIGGFTDAETAIDVLTTTINAYKLGVGAADTVSDKLVKTQKLGKTSVGELAKSIGQVIPIAAAYSTDIDNVSAAYVTLTRSGINTANATTNIKAMLSELGKSSSTVSKTLQELTGKTFAELMRDGKNLADVIDLLSSSVDGDSTAFSNLWGNVRAGTGALSLLNSGTDEYRIILDEMANSAGTAEDAYQKMAGTSEASTARMNAAIEDFKITFGNAMDPAMRAGEELVTGFFNTANDVFQSLPESVQTFLGTLGAVGTKVAEIIPGIMNFATQLATLKVMKTLSGDSAGLSGSLKKLKGVFNPLTVTIAGVSSALIAAWEAAKQISKEESELKASAEATASAYRGWNDEVADLMETIDTLGSAKEKQAAIQDMLTRGAELQRKAQREYNDSVVDGVAAVDEFIEVQNTELDTGGKILNSLFDVVTGVSKGIASVTADTAEEQAALNEVTSIGTVRMMGYTQSMDALGEANKKSGGTMDDLATTTAMLQEKLAQVQEEAAAEAETITNASGEIVAAKEASITVAGEELAAWNNLSDGTKAAAENVVEAVNGMHENITAAVQSVGNFFEEVKAQEEQSAQDMYTNMQAQISAIQEWEQTLVDLADRGINQGVLQYLAEAGPEGQAYAKAMLDGIINETGPGVDQWNSIFKDKLDLEAGINDEGQKLTTAVAEMAAGGEAAFREMAYKLNATTTNTGGFIVDGIVQGIQTAQKEAEAAGTELGSGTVDAVADGAQEGSPSRATMQTGKFIDLGLIRGMDSMKGQAAAKGREIATGVITAINSTNMGAAAEKVGQDIGAKISAGITAQQAVAAAATAALIAGITRSLQQGTVQTYQAAVQMLRQVTIGITSGAASGQSAAYSAGKGLVDSMASGLSSGSASAAARALASGVSAAAKNVDTTAAWWAGYYLAHGMAQGINAGSSAAINAAKQMAERAIKEAEKTLGIKSPSKVFKKIGEFTGAGYVRGITSMIKPAVKASKTFAQESVKATRKAMLDLTKKSNATNYSQVARDLMSSLTSRTEANIKKQTTAVERQVKRYFQTYEYSLDKEQAKIQKKIDSLGDGNKLSASQIQKRIKEITAQTEKEQAEIQKQIDATKDKDRRKQLQAQKREIAEKAKEQQRLLELQKDSNKEQAEAEKKSLQKQLEKLKKYSEQFKKIQNQLSTNISRELSDALNKSTAKVTENLSKKVTQYAEQMQAAMSKVNQSIANMRDKLAGYGDLFTTKRGIWGDETMVSNLKDQIKAIRKYRDNLNALKGKVSDSLMAEITSMGVDDAIKYTNELRSMSKSELKKYNDLYNQKIRLAKNISKTFYADEVAAIKKDYTDKVTKAFNDANKKIKNLGTQAIKGFIAGMKSVDVDVDVQKQANAIIRAFKKALKIKSPSRVFEEEIGEPSGEGAIMGFYKGMSPDASRIVGGVSMGLPDMSRYQAQAPQVYVYIGDRELSAVLSNSVIKQISGGARAYNAAGGRR